MPTTNGPSAPALITSGILSELLFDCMPMGIAIIDRAYRILRYNPTWEDFAARYVPAEGAPLRPGVNYFDFLPGSESTVLPLYQCVLAGRRWSNAWKSVRTSSRLCCSSPKMSAATAPWRKPFVARRESI